MTTKFNKKRLFASALLCSLVSAPAFATNWLMLQGTEPEGTAPRAKAWGFIQTTYQQNTSDKNIDPAGAGYAPPALVGPNLTSQSQFNVFRARIGLRGTGFPLDDKVNYFFLAEFGNNAITTPGNGNAYISDASITLNQIPGARVRVGLFKTPSSEEGLQGIATFDYVNFTTVTNQLLLERIPNQVNPGTTDTTTTPSIVTNTLDGPNSTALPTTADTLNRFDAPVSAFRDVGIQVFDTFAVNSWEHSYAVMVGNGNGTNFGDNDNKKDLYLYWSSELVGAGKGPFRQGLKMFVWSQTGKRLLDNTLDGTYNPTEFKRDRSGLGVKWLTSRFRVTAEYMKGKGMIFVGPNKPSFWVTTNGGPNKNVSLGDGATGKANGHYLEGGYFIPNSDWEVDARYDVYNRLAGDKMETDFKNFTLGAEYHFNKKTRLVMNATKMKANAPEFPTSGPAPKQGPNAVLSGLKNLYAIQLTHIF